MKTFLAYITMLFVIATAITFYTKNNIQKVEAKIQDATSVTEPIKQPIKIYPIKLIPESQTEQETALETIVERFEEETKPNKVYLGVFELTAYCSCEKCCGIYAQNRPVDENGKEIVVGSTGNRLYQGVSIAVDPKVIPYGSAVEIDGKTYTAQDCGGAIKRNRIDVYFDNHQDALKFGRQLKDVYLLVS